MKRALPQVLLVVALAALMNACAQTGEPLPPSLQLPATVPDLRAVRKANKVYLAWTMPSKTTDGDTIREVGPVHICRSLQSQFQECGTPVAEVPPQTLPQSSSKTAAPSTVGYTDVLPADLATNHPAADVYYVVEALNTRGRSAGLSNIVAVPLIPVLPAPQNFRAQLSSQGVQTTWACSSTPAAVSAGLQYRIRVYRREDGSHRARTVGEAGIADCPGSLLDQSLQWEKTYEYWATIVTVLFQPGRPTAQVEGGDTVAVRVVAKDSFPPAVPSGLEVVFSGPGQQPFVDLIWSPVMDADLAGYSVYRYEVRQAAVKINVQLVKTPAYRDTHVQPGHKYFYSVSAVDLRGNESARSEEASEAVP